MEFHLLQAGLEPNPHKKRGTTVFFVQFQYRNKLILKSPDIHYSNLFTKGDNDFDSGFQCKRCHFYTTLRHLLNTCPLCAHHKRCTSTPRGFQVLHFSLVMLMLFTLNNGKMFTLLNELTIDYVYIALIKNRLQSPPLICYCT